MLLAVGVNELLVLAELREAVTMEVTKLLGVELVLELVDSRLVVVLSVVSGRLVDVDVERTVVVVSRGVVEVVEVVVGVVLVVEVVEGVVREEVVEVVDGVEVVEVVVGVGVEVVEVVGSSSEVVSAGGRGLLSVVVVGSASDVVSDGVKPGRSTTLDPAPPPVVGVSGPCRLTLALNGCFRRCFIPFAWASMVKGSAALA